MREFRWCTPCLVGLDQPLKSLLDRTRQHGKFRSALLLFQYHERFIETLIPPLNVFAQNVDLRVLATQAENSRAGDVGVVKISSDEPAQIVCVFTRSAAASLMQQKPDAIHI